MNYPEYDWKQRLETLFSADIVKWPIPEIRQVLRTVCEDDAFSYAKELYSDSLKDESKEKLFKSIVILDITKGDIAGLDFSHISSSFLDKIENYFMEIHLNIGVPDDACYSDKKQVKLLETAVANKETFEIFSKVAPFLDGYNFLIISDCVVGTFARFLWIIDKAFIIEYLKENDWSFKMELVLHSLRTKFNDVIQEVMEGKNQYPYLYMIKSLVVDLEDGLKQGRFSLEHIPDYSDIIGTFIDHYAQSLDKFHIPFRLAISASYNFFAGRYCSEHQETLKKYLPFLPEILENAQEAFAYGYITHGMTNKVFDDSWMILNFWVSNCIKSYSRVNQYCGFINLFIVGLAFNFSTKEEYQNRLADLLNDIDELQYAWGKRNYPAKIIVVLYFILANKKKCFSFDEAEIKEHFPILLDGRYELIFGKNLLDSMLNLLKDPDHVEQIELVDSSGRDKIMGFVKV